MIHRFCDICGKEMTGDNIQLRVIHKTWTSGAGGEGSDKRQVHLELKIMRALNGTWNSGDVCTPCLLEAAANGEASPLKAV